MNDDENIFLDAQEAAKFLYISVKTLGFWRVKGRNKYSLPYIKVGRKPVYCLADLKKFLEDRKVK